MELDSSSHSSTASRYSSLLKQVADLQSDLSRTVGLVTTLRKEKENVLADNDNLRRDNIKVRSKYAELRSEYLRDNELRVSK